MVVVVNQEHKDDFCPKVKLFLFHIFMLVYCVEMLPNTLRKPPWFSDHLPDVMTSSKDPSLRILQSNDPKLWFANEILNHFCLFLARAWGLLRSKRMLLPLRVFRHAFTKNDSRMWQFPFLVSLFIKSAIHCLRGPIRLIWCWNSSWSVAFWLGSLKIEFWHLWQNS